MPWNTTRTAYFGLLALFGLAPSLPALENLTLHSCTAYIGGGYGRAVGNDSADLNHWGGIFQAGGGFGITPAFGLIFDFQYQQTRVTQTGLNSQSAPPASAGSVRFEDVTMEPTFVLWAKKNINVYAFAGFGWLQRSVKFTDPGGTITHPGSIEAPGGASADSGAFDIGGGVSFRIPHTRGLRAFVEGRYYHGLARNFDTTLIPLTAGIRW